VRPLYLLLQAATPITASGDTLRSTSSVIAAALALLGCEAGEVSPTADAGHEHSLPAPGDGAEETPEIAPLYNLSGTYWSDTDLRWCLKAPTSQMSLQDQVDAIQAAADTWAAVSNLTFTFRTHCGGADIVVKFKSRRHGDGHPFDGSGGELAHAFPPLDGRLHFDDSEDWSDEEDGDGAGALDLQTIALREIGHVIGIDDSADPDAVMVDDYTGSRRALTEDDVLAAQALYGPTRCWDAPADLEEAMDYGALATFAIWEVYDDTGDGYAEDAYEACLEGITLTQDALYYTERATLEPIEYTYYARSFTELAEEAFYDCYVSAWYSYYYGSGQAAAVEATFDMQNASDYLSYAWLDLWSCESGY